MSKGKGKKPITEEEISEIIHDLKNANLSQQEIATKYGVTQSTISKIKKKYKIQYDKSQQKPRIPDKIKEKIINDLATTDMSQKEIAKKYNVSRASVSLIKCDTRGLTKFRIPEDIKSKVIYDLENTDLTYEEIGEKYNISKSSVSRIRYANIDKKEDAIPCLLSIPLESKKEENIDRKIIYDLSVTDMSADDLAAKYNISKNYILKLQHQMLNKLSKKYDLKATTKTKSFAPYNLNNSNSIDEFVKNIHDTITTIDELDDACQKFANISRLNVTYAVSIISNKDIILNERSYIRISNNDFSIMYKSFDINNKEEK